MKVQVQSIKLDRSPRKFFVGVLIGTQPHEFIINVELDTIANQEILIISGDNNFSQTFRFNQIVASDICKVVAKVYNSETVQLPGEIGEFYPSKLEAAKV